MGRYLPSTKHSGLFSDLQFTTHFSNLDIPNLNNNKNVHTVNVPTQKIMNFPCDTVDITPRYFILPTQYVVPIWVNAVDFGFGG